MAMNIGNGFSMGNNMSMMGGMSGSMGSNGSTQNVLQYFTEKYGCEDCFKKGPYPEYMTLRYTPEPKELYKPSIIRKLSNFIFGG